MHGFMYMQMFSNKLLGKFVEICSDLENFTDELHGLEILKKLRKT